MNGVYPIDRRFLKGRSKEWMRTAVPAAWLVALVYLLATTGLSELIQAFMPVQQTMLDVEDAIMEGNIYQAQYVIQSMFRGTQGVIIIFVSVLLSLYSTIVNYGYVSYSMGVVRGQDPGYGELFSRFYMAGKIILAEVLAYLFTFLWSLLFIIPGLIASYRYRMIPYILLDDPDCPVMEAFRRSKALMRGRKWELFLLDYSFLLWLIGASVLTSVAGLIAYPVSVVVGIACNMFLVPYQQFTFSQWYDAIRAQNQAAENQQQPPQY
ncbi:MAG: DUF975 family protein [Candidatus Onthomonas sp.]